MPNQHPSERADVREIVRSARAEQREFIRQQEEADRRREKKAARRAKYKQNKDDSFLVFAWKELMR
jgi:hypothetical protein